MILKDDDDKIDDKYGNDNLKNAQECCSEKSGGEALQILDIIMIVRAMMEWGATLITTGKSAKVLFHLKFNVWL